MFFRKVWLSLAVFTLAGVSWSASQFVLQVGAFEAEDTALRRASELEEKGLAPVLVRPEESATKGLFYKVLLGNYETRAAATDGRTALEEQHGIKSYVRSAESYDLAEVRKIIAGPSEPYFSDTAPGAVDTMTTLTDDLINQRKEILGKETTSPATLAAYLEFINGLPDTSTAKSNEIITLGWYSFSGKSAYTGKVYDQSAALNLLMQVANGRVTATPARRTQAREMIAHNLHYYSHDYGSALAAYRQILATHLKDNSAGKAAKVRAEIAGASYEMTKASGFDRQLLQDSINQLWHDAITMQEVFVNDDLPEEYEKEARIVCTSTARIGLMLTEILMELKQWTEAKAIASELVSMYDDLSYCDGEKAESYCHLSKIGLRLQDKELCYSSYQKAIVLAEKTGRIWGDQSRDPLWKAYALKNAASYYFNESYEVREAIKNEMHVRFPGHPELSKYFGEELK